MDYFKAVNDNQETVVIQETPGTPVKVDPFDIEVAKKKLMPFKENVEKMINMVREHQITDDASQEQGITMAGQAAALSKKIKDLVESILRPHNDFRNGVNKMKKYFTDSLDMIPREIKKKNGEYLTKLRIDEQKRQAEEQKKKEALQKQLDKEAESAGVNKVELPNTPVVDKLENIKRTESGSSMSVKFKWQGTIINEDEVDRIYCDPSQKKIDDAVDAGLREARGIEIKEVPVQRLRA